MTGVIPNIGLAVVDSPFLKNKNIKLVHNCSKFLIIFSANITILAHFFKIRRNVCRSETKEVLLWCTINALK